MQTSPASVNETLKDTEYPAEKRDLVEHSRLHGASKGVLDDIKNLPIESTPAPQMLTEN